MFIRGDNLVACMSFIVVPCLQGNRIQETILHECVIYLVDDFWENNWYFIKDFKIRKTLVEPGQSIISLNSNSLYEPLLSTLLMYHLSTILRDSVI